VVAVALVGIFWLIPGRLAVESHRVAAPFGVPSVPLPFGERRMSMLPALARIPYGTGYAPAVLAVSFPQPRVGCISKQKSSSSIAHSSINATMYILGNQFLREPSMNANVVDVRNTFSEYLNRASYQGQRIVIERRGKPVAALVSLEDLELLNALDDQADVKAAKKARKEKGGVTLDQYCKKHGL
jgi:prevent-host-death family protein